MMARTKPERIPKSIISFMALGQGQFLVPQIREGCISAHADEHGQEGEEELDDAVPQGPHPDSFFIAQLHRLSR